MIDDNDPDKEAKEGIKEVKVLIKWILNVFLVMLIYATIFHIVKYLL